MVSSISVITIDGVSGSGKSTVLYGLAERLGWHKLQSGLIYRLLAYLAICRKLSPDDEKGIVLLAKGLSQSCPLEMQDREKILYSGKDVTQQLQQQDCANLASITSAYTQVRTYLLPIQHQYLKSPGLVAEGRDMGTVVFPQAQLKVYLESTLDVRAKRRFNQLKKCGLNVSLDSLVLELQQRDERDSHRAHAPLKIPDGAMRIDTSYIAADQVIDMIVDRWSKIAAKNGA